MRQTRIATAMTAVALLLVAACGDDSSDTATVQSGGGRLTEQPGDQVGNEAGEGAGDEPAGTGTPDSGADEATAEREAPPPMELILDASGSMNSRDGNGQTLLDGAKRALRDLVGELPDGQHVGLRVYGHTVPNTDQENGCRDTELIHPVSPLDREGLLEAIDGYDAMGFTPIGLSLREAGEDLPDEGARSIVLVSDGLDTCGDPDPCEVAEELAADGVDVTINTVGFALNQASPSEATEARDQLECIAEAANGTFVDAADTGELADALDDVAREERSYETRGGELTGAPIPRDAETGLVDTPYTDTAVGDETNFYRFEVTPGTTVRGELIVAGNPQGADENLFCPNPYLVTAGDSIEAASEDFSGGPADETYIKHTEEFEVEGDEIWLRVETGGCSGRTVDEGLEFDIEIQVTTV